MKFLVTNLKDFIRPYWGMRWLRKFFTSNYSSGRIALGERNTYLRNRTWITIDFENSDFIINFRDFTPLPFENDSQEAIYSAHAMEHIPVDSVEFLINESYRVLKKGGCIRIEVPDAEKIISSYKNNDRQILDICSNWFRNIKRYPAFYAEDHNVMVGNLSSYVVSERYSDGTVPVIAEKKEIDSKLETLTMEEFADWCVSLQTAEQMKSGGHVHPAFYNNFHALLKNAGFRNILKMDVHQSRIPKNNLREIERTHRGFFSFIIEAVK